MCPNVAALGELARLEGYRLAGAIVLAADTEDDVRRSWAGLADDTAVVLLTPRAADALGTARTAPGAPMTVVLPT
ncbi:MAG TPA: hypothetical protein PKN27_02945 [Propionibacteriaceae bacterium]|nr:hypothetical protein [Propionibacteriaceae bacterium]